MGNITPCQKEIILEGYSAGFSFLYYSHKSNNSMQKLRAFVFDIGDTIYPSSKMRTESLEELRDRHKLPGQFPKRYLEERAVIMERINSKATEKKVMQVTLNKMNIMLDPEGLAEEMCELYDERVKDYSKKELAGGFTEVIKFLREKGYKTAILSDNTVESKRRYSKIWAALGLRFDAFVVSEEIGENKPSKRMFDAILKLLGLKPEEAVYFGNNLKRDAAALDYNWDFVWVYGFMDASPEKFSGKKMKFITLENIRNYLEMLKKCD